MNIILLVLGIIILIIVSTDFLSTVFLQKGAGFLTQSVTISVARIFKFVARNRGANIMLDYKGVAIILSMVATWLILAWIGVTLIFSYDPFSIISDKTNEKASFFEKMYFCGYVLSTMGLGDFKPNGEFWKLFTSIVSVSGFLIVTISITYIVPVINNIIEKNTMSLQIASLGESSKEILVSGYNGENFENLSDQFSSLSNIIFRYAKNHAAYPILHHVHSSDKDENAILKLASLDEACNILLFHIPPEKCMQGINLKQLRQSITFYLQSVRNVKPADSPPPVPDLKELSRVLAISLVNTEPKKIESLYGRLQARRCLLKAIIEDDGFTWDDLQGNKFQTKLDA